MQVNAIICNKCLSVIDNEIQDPYVEFNNQNDDIIHIHVSCFNNLLPIEVLNLCGIFAMIKDHMNRYYGLTLTPDTQFNGNQMELLDQLSIKYPDLMPLCN